MGRFGTDSEPKAGYHPGILDMLDSKSLKAAAPSSLRTAFQMNIGKFLKISSDAIFCILRT